MIFLYLIIFVIACFVLIKSGGFLVKILIMLSRYFKLTEYVFSFVLMAFATSVPELFVGITSGIRGLSNISLGNIIGANLINLTLTLGIIVIVSKGLKIQSKIAKKDAWIVLFISLLPLLLLFDKNLSRGEGVLLVLVFAWYIYRILKDKDAFHKRMDHMKRDVGAYIKLVKNFLYFFIAFIFLIISSLVVVETAKLIAIELYLPLALVGIILVAIGTSLPELVFGVRAAVTKHEGLSLGTLIGSIVVNSTFILGLVAIIHPIQLESLNVIYIGGFFMVVSILLVNIFISSKEKISWKQGLFLILFYVAFLIVEFLFRG
ncbi:sodium:calcium antiporter [Patescibacteria group bacterium]|nr:sodium:calcium antiporter [Patescibacteria group bacterium]